MDGYRTIELHVSEAGSTDERYDEFKTIVGLLCRPLRGAPKGSKGVSRTATPLMRVLH
jgi:hypothetical protein